MEKNQTNQKLLESLSFLISKHPELRFGQLLRNFGFVEEIDYSKYREAPQYFWKNDFYTDSDEVLNRVKTSMGATHPEFKWK